MKSRLVRALTVTFSLLAGATGSAQPADADAIRSRLAAYAQARQQGDGTAQAAFYTEDADSWLSSTRKLSHGRAEIAKELHLPADANRKFSLKVENVSFVTPEVALVDAEYFGQAPTPNGHVVYVMVKRDGTWSIRATRAANYPKVAAPSQPRQ